MKKYLINYNYIVFGVCLLAGVITFFSMFDGVKYDGVIEFGIYGLLTLVVTGNLAWFVAKLVNRGEKANVGQVIASTVFIVLSIGVLLLMIWFLVLFYFLKSTGVLFG